MQIQKTTSLFRDQSFIIDIHNPPNHTLARHSDQLLIHVVFAKAELARSFLSDFAPPDVLLIILKGCNPIRRKRYCIVFNDVFLFTFHISSLGNLVAAFFNAVSSNARRALGFLVTDC